MQQILCLSRHVHCTRTHVPTCSQLTTRRPWRVRVCVRGACAAPQMLAQLTATLASRRPDSVAEMADAFELVVCTCNVAQPSTILSTHRLVGALFCACQLGGRVGQRRRVGGTATHVARCSRSLYAAPAAASVRAVGGRERPGWRKAGGRPRDCAACACRALHGGLQEQYFSLLDHKLPADDDSDFRKAVLSKVRLAQGSSKGTLRGGGVCSGADSPHWRCPRPCGCRGQQLDLGAADEGLCLPSAAIPRVGSAPGGAASDLAPIGPRPRLPLPPRLSSACGLQIVRRMQKESDQCSRVELWPLAVGFARIVKCEGVKVSGALTTIKRFLEKPASLPGGITMMVRVLEVAGQLVSGRGARGLAAAEARWR